MNYSLHVSQHMQCCVVVRQQFFSLFSEFWSVPIKMSSTLFTLIAKCVPWQYVYMLFRRFARFLKAKAFMKTKTKLIWNFIEISRAVICFVRLSFWGNTSLLRIEFFVKIFYGIQHRFLIYEKSLKQNKPSNGRTREGANKWIFFEIELRSE